MKSPYKIKLFMLGGTYYTRVLDLKKVGISETVIKHFIGIVKKKRVTYASLIEFLRVASSEHGYDYLSSSDNWRGLSLRIHLDLFGLDRRFASTISFGKKNIGIPNEYIKSVTVLGRTFSTIKNDDLTSLEILHFGDTLKNLRKKMEAERIAEKERILAVEAGIRSEVKSLISRFELDGTAREETFNYTRTMVLRFLKNHQASIGEFIASEDERKNKGWSNSCENGPFETVGDFLSFLDRDNDSHLVYSEVHYSICGGIYIAGLRNFDRDLFAKHSDSKIFEEEVAEESVDAYSNMFFKVCELNVSEIVNLPSSAKSVH